MDPVIKEMYITILREKYKYSIDKFGGVWFCDRIGRARSWLDYKWIKRYFI